MAESDANPMGGPQTLKLVTRQIRQQLEALQRAGIDHIPSLTVEGIEFAAPVLIAGQPDMPGSISTTPETIRGPGLPGPPRSPSTEPPTLKKAPAPKATPKASTNQAASDTLFGDVGFETPPIPAVERADRLLEIAKVVSTCPKCPILVATRNRTVFGDGSPTARLMFIGEAPGAEEDRRGIPFVGRAGQLLTDMITKGMGLSRDEVYITNVLKCRPPGNRDPLPDESANCLPYLEQQLEIIRPEFLCLLGRVAAQNLLQTTVAMGKLRGRWHSVRGIKALVTYHPSYLLRNPPAKKDAWEDLQIIMNEMGLKVPARKKE
jgi:DNA polymerase